MDRPIIFITRSWYGTGGMQQLSRDLSRELGSLYRERFCTIKPAVPGILGWVLLCITALKTAWLVRGKHASIHMGDASLLPLGYMLKCISGARLSATVCGLDVIYPAWWYQMFMRRSLPHADTLVCISNATRNAVIARGAQEARTIVIPCGIGDVAVSRGADSMQLLTVGRLIPRKGVAWFIEHALPLILREIPEVTYLILGAGPEEVRIRQIIQRHNLQNVVMLIPQSTHEERNQHLSSAAVFVAPNILRAGDMEGFGIVCIEASAHGTPVAAARLEGLIDAVIEGETGALFESTNAEDCARVVIALLQKRMNAQSIAHATQSYFNWDSLIIRYQHEVFAR